MRIGVLTGGGDVPGLNPCIKALVNRVTEDGHDVVGIRRGWAGLLECQPDDPKSVAACVVPRVARLHRPSPWTGTEHHSRINRSRDAGVGLVSRGAVSDRGRREHLELLASALAS